MLAESKKTFMHGFILTEAELRRLVDVIHEQFNKLGSNPIIRTSFQLKFINGVIADTNYIDEVLSQENIGSAQILRLSAKFVTDIQNEEIIVSFEFINADLDDQAGFISIRYTIRGNSRDWVFVTSTLLEERVAKVKRFAPNQLSGKGSKRFVPLLFSLLIPLTLMLTFSFSISHRNDFGTQLEQAWRAGEVTDPIQAIIFLEKAREATIQNSLYPISTISILLFGTIIFLCISGIFLWKYYPIFNFCWGDYIEIFNRRESTRKFILVVIIIGVVVSFVGGVLANLLKVT